MAVLFALLARSVRDLARRAAAHVHVCFRPCVDSAVWWHNPVLPGQVLRELLGTGDSEWIKKTVNSTFNRIYTCVCIYVCMDVSWHCFCEDPFFFLSLTLFTSDKILSITYGQYRIVIRPLILACFIR